MLDHVELEYEGKLVTADCRSVGVSTAGKARPSNARWQITVDGVTRDGFAGGPDDTEESVKAAVLAWLAIREERPRIPYRDYEIESLPYQLRDSLKWRVNLRLWRDKYGELAVKPYLVEKDFGSREEAALHGFLLGQKIIDGEVQPRVVGAAKD